MAGPEDPAARWSHERLLTTRKNLAYTYQVAGDLDRPLHETTLAQREQVFGATHLATLTVRAALARARDALKGEAAIPVDPRLYRPRSESL
ncbi:hypothetical protein KNE206_25860 [Kitasatospora sp. NE20-6]|uniref:hypothetical protein n=1 Tax=Kitasatospora sp. NE20-6 TaxID=2859066 RepID=UPI0034DC397E